MKDNYYNNQEKIYDAEVLESSTINENIIIKFLLNLEEQLQSLP